MSDVNNRSVFKMTVYAIPALRLLTWNEERIFSNVHLKKRYWLSGSQFHQFPSPCDLYSHCVIQAQSALSSVWYCQEELVYWAIWNNYTGSSQGKGALVVTAIHRQQKAKEREREEHYIDTQRIYSQEPWVAYQLDHYQTDPPPFPSQGFVSVCSHLMHRKKITSLIATSYKGCYVAAAFYQDLG